MVIGPLLRAPESDVELITCGIAHGAEWLVWSDHTLYMTQPGSALTTAESKVLRALENWPDDSLPPVVREYLRRLKAKGRVELGSRRVRTIPLTGVRQNSVRISFPEPLTTNLPVDSLGGPQAFMRLLEAHARTIPMRKGGFLWHEGDSADRLVQVEHGLLRAIRTFEDGRSTTLLRFGPGDVLGFAPFFDGAGYPASVEALEASRVRVVHRQDLEFAMKDPRISMALLALLARRLRKAFDTIEHLSIRSAVNRVASALEPLVPGGPYPIVTIPGTARAFAEAIGLTPASLSRALALLVRRGVLHRLGPGKYQVIHLEALRHLTSEADSDRT